jgi:hypothetical protein
MYCENKSQRHDKIGDSSDPYRLHVKSLFQLPHDIIDIFLEVSPPVQVNFMRFACSGALGEYFAYVAFRSSRSRAEGRIVVGAREATRDMLCVQQPIGGRKSMKNLGS